MKIPFGQFFRSLLKQSPSAIPRAEQSETSAVTPGERPLSAEHIRTMLLDALDDPAFARALARRLALPTLPIQGGACTISPGDIQAGDFNCSGNYTFSGAKVGIGTASPAFPLTIYSNNSSVDSMLSIQQEGTGDAGMYFRIVGQANYHMGIDNSDGNKLKIAYNSNDVGVDTVLTINTSGNVGIGTSDPQAKLHVKGGGITIEDDMGAGRLGFAETDEDDARIVLYRGGTVCGEEDEGTPDITILRNFPQEADDCVKWTLLRVWTPKVLSGTPDREATISLVRDLNSTDDDSQEFIDLYNNGYASETQHGIRIQKRTGSTTAQYRDFVFDQFDGIDRDIKLQIMTLASDRTVQLRSHGDTTDWSGTDSIHATGAVTTTDGSVTTLASITLTDGRAYNIVARVVGRKSDGSQRAFYWRAVLAYRQGGNATIEGSVVSLATVESASATTWDFTLDANGNDVRLRVTGAASTTIYWVATIEYQSVSTNS